MDKRINILGVDIDNMDFNETMEKLSSLLSQDKRGMVVTANPEIVMTAREQPEYAELLSKAEVITADGIGIIIASKIFGCSLKERVTGIDLCRGLFTLASEEGYSIYFLGAHPEVVQKAVGNVQEQYPDLKIAGYHHGYFKESEEIVKDIKKVKPDILLVALGMGKQEKWMNQYQEEVGASLAMGVGGSFDVFAGVVKRAPTWMQAMGLEWLYRLVTQPSRFFRMLQLPKFLLLVVAKRLGLKI